jgi:hypothetical protein
MLHWKVRRSWDELPDARSSASSYARSYAAVKVGGDDEAQTTIEFDSSYAGASALAAQYVLVPFLEAEDRPPRRVLVGATGEIATLEP